MHVATMVATETPKAVSQRSETVRIWLYQTLFTNLCGVTFGDWWQALRENRFAIDLPRCPRAAILTVGSVLNSYYKRREEREFGEALAQVQVRPPLFILGHWRSGTTLLHNLLALDDRFAYPNLYQAFFPHTFLCTEDARTNLVRTLVPQTRSFDNVAQGLQMPNEDEFATCTASLRSPYMAWAFPQNQEHYERFLTFRDASAVDVARWKDELVMFLKKLTLRHDRPMLLKSPPHTCRIKLLLELFPEARFLHISRNPYTVFQSTKHLNRALTQSLRFQRPGADDPDEAVLRRYQLMYDAYFEERDLIPADRLYELAFEDLENDPVGQIRGAYEQLGLADFDAVLPRLEEYVGSLANYRKNEYPNLPLSLRRRIRTSWAKSFDEWDYPVD
jgi:omega-hydroxy-beta-dihydromenaquinone-9 sulfotransferase